MKIIEIHIVGFGKLIDKKYSLNCVNSILQDNGEGKSTLANFIECIFYGIDAKNSSLRAYKPWNAEYFGGSITFSVGNKTYRVERSFGKRKSDDEFKLFLMPEKILSLDFSEKLGEELFGVDRSGFKRTCFFTHEQYEGGESSIQARLNSLVANTDEFNGFEKIVASIEKEIKTYENAQHRGKLPDIKRELEELRVKIAGLETAPNLYALKTNEQKELSQKINDLKQEISSLDTQIEKQLLLAGNGNQKALEVLTQRENEINNDLSANQRLLKGYNLTPPVLQKVADEKRKLDQAEKDLTQVNNALSFNFVSEKPLPSNELLNLAKSNLSTINNLERENASAQKKRNRNKGLAVSLILIALCLFALAIFTVKNYLFVAIPAGVLGCLNFAIAIYFLSINPLKKINAQIFKLSADLDTFLKTYGYGGYEPNSAINLMQSQIELEQEKLAKLNSLGAEKQRLTAEIEQFKRNIDGFFAKFDLYGSVEENLYTLKSAIEKIEKAKEQLSQLSLEKIKYSAQNSTPEKERLESLKQQKRLKQTELVDLNNLLQDNQVYLAKLTEQINLLTSLTTQRNFYLDEQKRLEKERYLLQQTLEGLILAKQNLTNGAYEPIKKSLQYYCQKLMPDYNGFTVDTDFNVTYVHGGVTRDFSSLSVGQKQLVGFALRLGLIDALFEKEKPFIIIDDAFSLLDTSNFKLCNELVKEISKNMQVIYFTPHESRTIKV